MLELFSTQTLLGKNDLCFELRLSVKNFKLSFLIAEEDMPEQSFRIYRTLE